MLSSDLPYPLLSNPDGINITEEVYIVVILLYMIYIMSVSCQLVQSRCDDCVVPVSGFYISLNSVELTVIIALYFQDIRVTVE